jgi:hypothetical protein
MVPQPPSALARSAKVATVARWRARSGIYGTSEPLVGRAAWIVAAWLVQLEYGKFAEPPLMDDEVFRYSNSLGDVRLSEGAFRDGAMM